MHWGRRFFPGEAGSSLGEDHPEPRGALRRGGGAGYPGGVRRLAVANVFGEQRRARSARAGVTGPGGGCLRADPTRRGPGGGVEELA